MRDHSLEPLKKHLGNHEHHKNKEVKMALHEWLTLQGPDLYPDGLFNLCCDWTNASMCLRIMLTNNDTSEK